MIAAFYGRVSTQRQEDEETIENQVLTTKDFAKDNGHTIIKEYRDEGWSGTILARPALDELRIDTKKKLWEAVIVYDPDRFARKYSYQALIIDELEEAGIKVLFVTTPPPKDDSDRLLYGVKGLFAEYERTRIADRFRLGKLRKAREGNVVTGQAPFGYTYILKTKDREGYYEINKREANIVKMIFKWIGEEGLTIRKVVKKFEELGIPPRKSKRGVWNTSTLVNLLRNETYIGNAHYNRSYAVVPEKPLKNEKYKKIKKTSRKFKPEQEWISIKTPAIIDKKLYDKTHEQLKKNFELCKRNRKNDYLLAGKIYCVCGNRRTGEGAQRGKHLYYRCADRVKSFPLPPNCREKGVNARIADKLVWEELKIVISSPDRVRKYLNDWIINGQNNTISESKYSVDGLEDQLNKIKKEEKRYIKVYGEGLITQDEFKDMVSDLRLKEVSLERQISSVAQKEEPANIVAPTEDAINEFSKEYAAVLNGLNFEAKRAMMLHKVEKAIADQKTVRVLGYLNLEEINNYVKFRSECGDCGTTKCGEEHFV